ncbi:MAG TPA: MarR family transcriptional regulator [Sphingobium sp.]|uniref:MarR family winged helix-turn-helix transcriptional regulator n=1 Tax=Sphingobium sp. TaxID=1912891 RepID=UPI002ED64A5D
MSKAPHPDQRPVEEVMAARAFYAELGLDVTYFSALWHTFNIGHMLSTDLDRICRRHDLSIADFNLMGALRIDRPLPLRATDLAVTLQVSNGALSARIAKLADKGMLVKSPAAGDRRAFTLELTPDGARKVEAIHAAIEGESHFVHEVNRLPEDDRVALERIMGELHSRLDRYFVHAHR